MAVAKGVLTLSSRFGRKSSLLLTKCSHVERTGLVLEKEKASRQFHVPVSAVFPVGCKLFHFFEPQSPLVRNKHNNSVVDSKWQSNLWRSSH